MKRSFPAGILSLVAIYMTVTAFQCGSAEMTTAKLAIKNGQYDKAEESLVRAVEKNPQEEEAWFLLGQVRLEQKNYLGMNEAYTRALGISTAHEREIRNNRSVVWNELYNGATEDYDKAQDQPEYYQSAAEKLTTAMAINPDSVQTYFALGLVHYSEGENDKAAGYLGSALERRPDYVEAMNILSSIHLDAAVDLEVAGDDEAAKKEYGVAADLLEKAFELNPEESGNINNLIIALERSGQPGRAKTLTSEAVKENPENPTFRYAYGVYLLNDGSFEESVKHFSKACELDPQNANYAYNCGAAYLNWGVSMKQEADAKLEANKGKNAKPDLSYQEKFRVALPYLEKSTELKPDDAEFWSSLAKAYTYLGMVKESKAAYDQFDRLTQ
ncbi:MAG: tetratricopeptide repeat protein [Ignavibacteria bacterium]|nr:tetratricopeptide repeat protein [Ignavibacteria bacterium]